MKNSSVVGSMNTFLYKSTVKLSEWISPKLKTVSDNWWNDCVIKPLSYLQRDTIKENSASDLTELDLAALLRITEKNWSSFRSTFNLTDNDKQCVKDMIDVRNNWAHIHSQLPDIDSIVHDAETIESFLGQLSSKYDDIQSIRFFINQLTKDGIIIDDSKEDTRNQSTNEKLGALANRLEVFNKAFCSDNDKRVLLSENNNYTLNITDESTGKTFNVTNISVIGRGSSCLVYSGILNTTIKEKTITQNVVIKEFYPIALSEKGIKRKDGITLDIPQKLRSEFDKELDHFVDGQIKHILFANENSNKALSPMFYAGAENNTYYFISKLTNGSVLSDDTRKDLTIVKALELAKSICEDIYAVHKGQDGIPQLYLDCKPSNLYTVGTSVYLFDFDTVQNYKELEFCSRSEGWSAPEQEFNKEKTGYKDIRKIGFQSDVFSIGAVLFWLLTGKKPSVKDLDDIQKNFDWQHEITLRDTTDALQDEDFIYELDNVMKDLLCYDADERAKIFGNSNAAKDARRYINYVLRAANDVVAKKRHKETNEHIESAKNEVLAEVSSVNESVEILSLQIDENTQNLSSKLDEAIGLLKVKEIKGATTEPISDKLNTAQDKYEGETIDNIPNGKGVYRFHTGEIYKGFFKDGKPNGKINYSSPKYLEYGIDKLICELIDFSLPSYGTVYYSNGDVYNGDILDGLPHNHGIIHYKLGDIYDGEFINGKREGFGVLNFENGDIFAGKFKSDSWNIGVYYHNENDSIFIGEFNNGKREGQGILIDSEGSKYEGAFTKNELNGIITITNSNGETFNRFFIDGKQATKSMFDTVDIDDVQFQFIKMIVYLSIIKESHYSFTTKKRVYRVFRTIKYLLKSNEGKSLLKERASTIIKELTLCKAKYSKEAVRAGDTSLYDVVNSIDPIIEEIDQIRESTWGWGPERSLYSKTDFIAYPTINSISDNATIGDERIFVKIKRHGEKVFGVDVPIISPGEKYDVRIYFSNNANSNIEKEYSCAYDVKVSSRFPVILQKGKKDEVSATITSSNCSPDSVWNQRYITTNHNKLYLRYIPQSAIIVNTGTSNGAHIPDNLFTYEGTKIGYNTLNGELPSGENFSGFIEYTIEAEERNGQIIQEVSYDGINYQKSINGRPNSDVYYRLTIKNIGDKPITNTTIKGFLSKGLSLIPGSVKLTANNSKIKDTLPNGYDKNGYNLGTIGVGNIVYIYYKCRVSNDVKTGDTLLSAVYFVFDNENKEGEWKYDANRIHITQLAISPWGPNRKTFTWSNPAPFATFNSITDNPSLGDERNFVRIREANATNKFDDEVIVSAGKIYEVYIYYDNNASPTLSQMEGGKAIDVRVTSSFPKVLTPNKKYIANATITSSNTNPSAVWDGAYLSADEKILLEYVPNSARLHSYTETDNSLLNPDELFSEKGAPIITHSNRPGTITSDESEACGHIIYCLYARKFKDNKENTNTKEI